MVKTSVLISDYSHRSEDLQFFTLEALFKKYIIEQLMKAVARTGDVVSSSSSVTKLKGVELIQRVAFSFGSHGL